MPALLRPGRENARAAGDTLGVDWGVVPLPAWQAALGVELEHGSALGPATDVTGDDLVATGRIALAHLLEDPHYYQRLARMESEAEAYWAARPKPSPVRGGGKSAGAVLALVIVSVLALLVLLLVLAARFHRAPPAIWIARYSR